MDELSPFYSLLTTNYSLSNEEKLKLADYLTEPTSKIARLQEEIRLARAHLDALLKQYNALSQNIEAHRALTAPIRRVPTDVLEQIFLFCLPETHNPLISCRHCPILLTQVCSSWRYIALETKTLWASIHIAFSNRWERQATAINEWLGRSGSCSLDISIYDGKHTTQQEIPFDTLLAFSARWGVLRCKTTPTNFHRIAAHPGTTFPRLHTIEFTANTRGVRPHILWADCGMFQAPNLRQISYSEPTGDFTRIPLCWMQLTSISLEGTLSESQLSRILSACPLLSYLNVCIKGSTPTINTTPNHTHALITLSHLKHLIFDIVIGNHVKILKTLDLPGLEILEIRSSIAFSKMHSLLERTAPTLRELAFNPQGFSQDELFSLMGSCINLAILKLQVARHSLFNSYSQMTSSTPLDDEFVLRLFTISPTRPVLLPRLTSFICDINFGSFASHNLSDILLLDHIQARNSAAESGLFPHLEKLKKVDVTFSVTQKQTILPRLNALAQAGVECRFNYPPPATLNKNVTEQYSPADGTMSGVPKVNRWDTQVF